MATVTQLPVPSFFDASKAESVWRVPYGDRAQEANEWKKVHGIRPAATDQVKVGLLIIDNQNTFCVPGFELFVAGRSGNGAVEDTGRLCKFIYENLGVISGISATLDTHYTMQIFHPLFWVDQSGNPVSATTIISHDDVKNGKWRVNPAVIHWLFKGNESYAQRYALHYTKTLADGGKYPLMVWPYHAMLGGIGHALVSSVEEALFFHSIARVSPTRYETKGQNGVTENYSPFEAEVKSSFDGITIQQTNTGLLKVLTQYDVLAVAGQAKSHCVSWAIDSLLGYITTVDPSLAKKVYLLEDATSPVVVPGFDFTDQADRAFQRFKDAGMHVVKTTDPIQSWPGVRL